MGDAKSGDGFVVRGIRWPHAQVEGEQVHGIVYLPDPAPDGPVPLLLTVQGHLGDEKAGGEVDPLSQFAARSGWMVLSLTTRGLEHGESTPAWRQLHHRSALYAQLRSRRSGGTPLGWDVVAGWSAVDLASVGRLPLPVDMDRIGVLGVAGGAERAAAIAATDPRIGPVVIDGYELAFRSEGGRAACSCGVLRGAGAPLQGTVTGDELARVSMNEQEPPVQAWRWLGLAACRPGMTPSPRPVLGWDRESADRSERELRMVPGVDIRQAAESGGLGAGGAATSWGWMSAAFGTDVSRSRIEESENWIAKHSSQAGRIPSFSFVESQPAPGRFEQGPPPWRVDETPNPAAAQMMLGLVGGRGEPSDPGLALQVLEETEETLLEPKDAAVPPSGRRDAWLVVLGEDAPLQAVGGLAAVAEARPDAVVLVLRHRLLARDGDIARPVSLGIELGVPALGVAVHDVLAAHRSLTNHPDVNPAGIGMLAIGSGAVPALQAALLIGEGGPIGLVQAPTTLFFEGPREGDAPFTPWPEWVMVPLPGGASFDPWLAVRSLEDRVRWLEPMGGDGAPWDANLPHGAIVSNVSDLLAPDRRAR